MTQEQHSNSGGNTSRVDHQRQSAAILVFYIRYYHALYRPLMLAVVDKANNMLG